MADVAADLNDVDAWIASVSGDMPGWIDGISDADLEIIAQRLGVTADAIRNGDEDLKMDAAAEFGRLAVELHGYVSKEKAEWAADQFRPLD